MQRDSASFTLLVATVLCVVCSMLVAGAAVLLRPIQEANKRLDRQRNVLIAIAARDQPGDGESAASEDHDALTVAQVRAMSADEITNVFDKMIERELVDTETGQAVSLEEAGVEADYDPKDALTKPQFTVAIPAEDDAAGIRKKAKYAYVYKVLGDDGQIEKLVLPIHGKGLWSTIYGFLAVESDGQTVSGVTFYEHGETPGLGGEVENDAWQGQWTGKTLYGDEGEVALAVIKGAVNSEQAGAEFEIDGLSGATITSKGVSNMIEYWLGPHGFQPYLQSLSQSAAGGVDG